VLAFACWCQELGAGAQVDSTPDARVRALLADPPQHDPPPPTRPPKP